MKDRPNVKPHKYNPFMDNLIITGIAIALAIVIGLAIWLNLWDYLGTVGTAALSIATTAGLAGMVGIDDWFIWYKRWIVKKFNNTEGTFIVKLYDQNLNKQWVECPMKVYGVLYDQQQNPYFHVSVDGTNMIYMTFNPFTGNPTLCDHEGYKFGSKMFKISKLSNPIMDSEEKIRFIARDYFKSDKMNFKEVSFNPDSFYYKNRVKVEQDLVKIENLINQK